MHVRFLLLSAVMLLGACQPNKPWLMEDTNTVEGKMRLIESRYVEKKPLSAFSDDDLADAAYRYKRHGSGPVYIAVAYDDTQTKAIDPAIAARAQALAAGLVTNGVTGKIVVSTVQLDAPVPVAVIAFDTLEAAAPAACDQVPTMDEAVLANNDGKAGYDYKLGCGVKSMMAQQIARSDDLEGRARLSPADAERLSNIIINDYRKGETHDFLPSYIISELAGQGG